MRMRERMELRIAPMMALAAMGMLLWDQSGLVAVTLVAAFVHECGHLLAGRLLGVGFSGLRIGLSGVRLDVRGRMLSYGEEWTLAAAGPLFSLLAAGAASPLWARFSAAWLFSCASLLLGVLNLLPIRTFDGGRMTECLLAQLMGERACERVLRGVSFAFLLLLWCVAVYFLLRAGDGLSLLCFSMTLFFRFFDGREL